MKVVKNVHNGASLVAQLVKNPNGRPAFDPWVGKIPWRKERPPTLVFWPGEFPGLYSPWGCKESDTTEGLSQGSKITCIHKKQCRDTQAIRSKI